MLRVLAGHPCTVAMTLPALSSAVILIWAPAGAAQLFFSLPVSLRAGHGLARQSS